MGADHDATIVDEFEKLAQLLSMIGDRNISKQEADQLTDRVSQLIWEVSDVGSASDQGLSSTKRQA